MADDAKSFFLGVNGEQQGPFSEDEVRKKLDSGEIAGEALVWYEGLADWQPISSISYFKTESAIEPPPDPETREKTIAAIAAPPPAGRFKPLSEVLGNSPVEASPAEPEPSLSNFSSRNARALPEKSETVEAHEPAWKKKGIKPSAPAKGEVILTFALSGNRPRAVFSKKEGVFGSSSGNRLLLIALGIVFLGGVGGFYFNNLKGPSSKPEVVEKKIEEPRDVRLTRAKDDIILNPAGGVLEMKRLLTENSKDEVGKAAYQAVELYYWEKQDYKGLGELAMSVGEHAKAVDYFLKDPRLVSEAELAYRGIVGATTDLTEKKKALLASIELLLGPLKRKEEAIGQIQLFEKTFPQEPHPYQFYTMPPPQQISELFERTSFYFLSNLNGFVEGEFPHMKLLTDPVVEVRKEGTHYRISGSYKGDVRLYRDRLKGVFFHFWLTDGQWHVVETNVTADRKKYAQEKKEQLVAKTLDEAGMLKYLESVFEQEFPRTPLHVRAPRNTAASAPRDASP